MVKTLKNLLQNHQTNCLETWYVAFVGLVLQSLYKWWPCVDLDLFYSNFRFGPLGFGMGNTEKVYFLVAIVLFDVEMHWNSTHMKF